MEFFDKKLGNIAEVSLGIKDGKLILAGEIPLIQLLDQGIAKAKAAIPGTVDDAIFDVVSAAIKAAILK